MEPRMPLMRRYRTPEPRVDAHQSVPTAAPTNHRGLALLVLSVAAGLALVLLSTAVFIRLVQT